MVSKRDQEAYMKLMIGIDPHKASHTAVAIGHDEDQISSVKVRATLLRFDRSLKRAKFGFRPRHGSPRTGVRGDATVAPYSPVMLCRLGGSDFSDGGATCRSRELPWFQVR